jgi:hypothetical protein
MSSFHRFLPLLALSLGAQPGHAATPDQPGVTVTDAGSRVIYGPEYFARFNVITASDQLERIPGIQGVLDGGGDGGGRGFGNSGDQILINGKRLAGKTNDIGSTLDRIQARQVLRVEVIRGTVDNLDVRSQGLVVNVVLNETLSTSYGSWEASVNHYSDGRAAPGGELNYTGNLGALNYLASLAADPRLEREAQHDLFYTPDGLLDERQAEENVSDSDEYTFTANTAYALSNADLLNFNVLYAREDETGDLFSDRFLSQPTGEVFDRQVVISNEDLSDDWELGGDYQHSQANGNVLTTLFVVSGRQNEETSSEGEATGDGGATQDEVQWEQSDDLERILRGTYRWGVTPTRAIESGAELAFNTTERHIRLFEHDGGALAEVPVANAVSTVEEQRFEAFTTYTWNLRPDLLLEGSLDIEYSEISQKSDIVERARNFVYLRPRLVLRRDLANGVQLRATIERTVAQLDFDDFSASFSNDDNRRDVISAGNPGLVPERAWHYELTWEKRLPDDLGLVSLTGAYDAITDHQARIPLVLIDAEGNQEERTAPGNIGDAHLASLTFDGSLRLGWLGLERALLEGSLEVTDSEALDPFTHDSRVINETPPWEWSLSFRHDTRWKNLSYGVSTWQRGDTEQFDRDFRQRSRIRPDLELFVEMQPMQNLTLRLELEEVLRSESERERFQFIGNRGDGLLERHELRNARPQRELTFSVRGVF